MEKSNLKQIVGAFQQYSVRGRPFSNAYGFNGHIFLGENNRISGFLDDAYAHSTFQGYFDNDGLLNLRKKGWRQRWGAELPFTFYYFGNKIDDFYVGVFTDGASFDDAHGTFILQLNETNPSPEIIKKAKETFDPNFNLEGLNSTAIKNLPLYIKEDPNWKEFLEAIKKGTKPIEKLMRRFIEDINPKHFYHF